MTLQAQRNYYLFSWNHLFPPEWEAKQFYSNLFKHEPTNCNNHPSKFNRMWTWNLLFCALIIFLGCYPSPSRHIIFLVIVYYFYVHGKINNAHSKSMERETNGGKSDMLNYLGTAQIIFTWLARSLSCSSRHFDRSVDATRSDPYRRSLLSRSHKHFFLLAPPFSEEKCFGFFFFRPTTFSRIASTYCLTLGK